MDADTEFEFGTFRLLTARRELLSDGMPVAIGSRAFDVLLALVQRGGQLATKAELMDEVWPDTAVEEGNLTSQVASLRRVLGDREGGQRYILTVAGRGYRFVSAIAQKSAGPSVPAAALRGGGVEEPPTHRPERHNLPLEATSFIGRETALAEIRDRLRTKRLITLVGSGGIGKTRAALRIGADMAEAFTHGVWLVELAPLSDPRLVAEAVCRAVGTAVSADRPAVDGAVAFLRTRQTLLILDNCEHLLEGVAILAAALLRHCPEVSMLVTTREKLGIGGESLYRLPAMPVPIARHAITAAIAMQSEAVRLFVERAADASGDFGLSDADAPAVVSICRRLGGVAMAIELAAARLRMLKPAEIAARLENVFTLLTGGNKAALPHQQTLRATIDWSFTLLTPAEQHVFCCLSVFADGFSLAGAIATICAPAGPAEISEDEVVELLSALVDKSLVVADTAGPATRYRMLETTRQYAHAKLLAAGGADRHCRLAEYLVAHYARAEKAWPTMPTESWLAEFAPELENLRASIDWAFAPRPDGTSDSEHRIGVALVAVAGTLAEEMSLQADMKRWTALALNHAAPDAPLGQVAWVRYWAQRHHTTFGADCSSEARSETIGMFRSVGDKIGLACALRTSAIASARPGSVSQEAFASMIEAFTLLQPLGISKHLAIALGHLGSMHYLNRSPSEARRLNEESLAMRRQLGDVSGVLASYINIAELEAAEGNLAAAIFYARQGTAEARRRNVLVMLAITSANLAGYLLATDAVTAAQAAGAEALQVSRALGYDDYAAVCLEHLALAASLGDDDLLAARLYGHTDAYFRRTGQVRDILEQTGCDRLVTRLTESLPADHFVTLMQQGAAWTSEEATSAALGSMPALEAWLGATEEAAGGMAHAFH